MKKMAVLVIALLVGLCALGTSYSAWSQSLNIGTNANPNTIALAQKPTVTTSEATSVTNNSGTLNGSLTALGTLAPSGGVGLSFDYTTDSNFINNVLNVAPNPSFYNGDPPYSFNANATSLNPSSTYYFRAKAVGSYFTVYSHTPNLSFVTSASTTTVQLNPTSGLDTTASRNTALSLSDLTNIATSNDLRYITARWANGYIDNDVLDFKFSTIPSSAVVDSVTLKFEWAFTSSSFDGARIRISTDSGTSFPTTYTLTPGTQNNDRLETISLAGITTAAQLNAIVVRFQGTHNGNNTTRHDWVQLNVTYH